MRVAIYQPRYFPQLHYFNRMIESDTFVFLDWAQYTKSLTHNYNGMKKRFKSFQSDTPIKIPSGLSILTVPIGHPHTTALHETQIDYSQKWQTKHLGYIKIAYERSLNFGVLFPQIKNLLLKQYRSLAMLNITTILWAFMYLLGQTVSSSEVNVDMVNSFLALGTTKIRLKKILMCNQLGVSRPDGPHKGTEWTAAICEKLGATEYLHGGTARESYMDISYYQARGITPVIQNWKGTAYPQLFERHGFLPNLSILDLLFNVPLRKAQQIIGII